MTSRNSFFKLMKEDLRQRLWTIVLACIAFLLPIPIYLGMMVTKYTGTTYYNFSNQLASTLDVECVWLILVTVVGALICAVSGFGYLFSKKKVDFFHALPVKREKLFAVRYLNGVLIYLVPYLVLLLISFLIIAISGYLNWSVFQTAMEGLLVHLMGYLTIYTTFILCVTFVGNIVVFFAVSGWTFGITAITLLLYTWFEEMFFNTYSYLSNAFEERLYSLRFLCPGYFYVVQISDPSVSLLLQQLAFTAVLVAITLLIYRIRPSDGAGKAIAFPILKPILRISVEILAGACIGMLFFDIADNSVGVPGWMIFGVVLGVVLSHMLIQSIFHYDIRKCFADKLSMAVCAVVSIAFVLVMRYDVFGYDTYLPKEKKIESVAVEVDSLDGYRNAYYYGENGREYVDEIEHMELTDIAAVYPYLETLVEDTEYYFDVREQQSTWLGGYLRVNVAYRLENGKTVYRRYMAKGIREEQFAPVFESTEYKECHYADIYTMQIENLHYVTAKNAMNEQMMSLSKAEREELMAMLCKELSAQTLEEKLDTLPVAILNFMVVETNTYYDWEGKLRTNTYNTEHVLPIYASYTETLAFLAERGFTANKEYEWTGEEKVWLNYPRASKAGTSTTTYYEYYEGSAEVSYIVDDNTMSQEIYYDYTDVEIKEKYWEEVYALGQWTELFGYGDPSGSTSGYYTLNVRVALDGYNNYETYQFYISPASNVLDMIE